MADKVLKKLTIDSESMQILFPLPIDVHITTPVSVPRSTVGQTLMWTPYADGYFVGWGTVRFDTDPSGYRFADALLDASDSSTAQSGMRITMSSNTYCQLSFPISGKVTKNKQVVLRYAHYASVADLDITDLKFSGLFYPEL